MILMVRIAHNIMGLTQNGVNELEDSGSVYSSMVETEEDVPLLIVWKTQDVDETLGVVSRLGNPMQECVSP